MLDGPNGQTQVISEKREVVNPVDEQSLVQAQPATEPAPTEEPKAAAQPAIPDWQPQSAKECEAVGEKETCETDAASVDVLPRKPSILAMGGSHLVVVALWCGSAFCFWMGLRSRPDNLGYVIVGVALFTAAGGLSICWNLDEF